MTSAILTMCLAVPMSYDAAYSEALHQGKPLVVFIGCPPLKVDGAITYAASKVEWYKGTGIVVSLPRPAASGPWLEWCETLPAMATLSQVQAAIAKHKGLNQAPTIYLHPFIDPRPSFFRGGGRSC